MKTTILWFRQDLRLQDNPALTAALQRGGPILPVYIRAPEEEGDWPMGAAARWWLHHSLASLARTLNAYGSCLILRQGASLAVLHDLVVKTGADAIYWNRRYEPGARQQDNLLQARLTAEGVQVESFNASLLLEPEQVSNRNGQPFQVFTPFWNQCLAVLPGWKVLEAPASLPTPAHLPESETLADMRLLPKPDWASGLRAAWQPGEPGAATQLQRFLGNALSDYPFQRDRPDSEGVSRLSPHLHFGEIGPRQIWRAVKTYLEMHGFAQKEAASVDSYLRQLGWREFAYHLLTHFPHTPDAPLRSEFAAFPWKDDDSALKAWQQGRTGYPLVDAGMRELWATGWMHNRVRMVVASFLVKDLLIPWQNGARWFWDTLVDADLANNTLGWQWTAGCGADAAPYFRIFNPVAQGEKFDPCGDYVRHWVPELSRLPALWIHHPWEAPDVTLQEAGITLGATYPYPIVDHIFARERAHNAFATLRALKITQ